MNLYILACIEHIILCVVLFRWIGKFTDNLNKKIMILVFSSMAICNGYITTRPYQLTMCISLCFLMSLLTYSRSPKHPEHFLKLCLKMFLLAVLQANYQISFLILLVIWPLCFFVPSIYDLVRTSRTKNFLNCLLLFKTSIHLPLVWLMVLIGGIINPYGLDGALYLFRSKDAIGQTADLIAELGAPDMISSTQALLMLICIPFVYFLILKKDFNIIEPFLIYLSLGVCILCLFHYRYLWFLVPSASALLALMPYSETTTNYNYSLSKGLLILFLTVLGSIIILNTDHTKKHNMRAHQEVFDFYRGLPAADQTP